MQDHINYLAAICAASGVTNAVLCPGSRNAPLLLAFSRCPGIKSISVPDERSAAFIALGMASASGKPVVLVCTSGTAVLNLYPAVAEAYYRGVPLVILTADRPPELIDQWDGQAIHQPGIFDGHIVQSYDITALLSGVDPSRNILLTMSDAFLFARKGPVHVNLPFREPFYPSPDQAFIFPEPRVPEHPDFIPEFIPDALKQAVRSSAKILVLAGQGVPSADLKVLLKQLRDTGKVVVLGDITSNMHEVSSVKHWDLIAGHADSELEPELLITIGTSIVAKSLKLLLRKVKPKHFHIGPLHRPEDPFFTTPEMVICKESNFFQELLHIASSKPENTYLEAWKRAGSKVINALAPESFNEAFAAKTVLENMPADSDLHLSNSMPVRYGSVFGVNKNDINVYSNRGTSGIDGCTSTAVGSAIASGRPTYLITGDVAFFYDVNAFWHNHIPSELKIVLFNNRGGGIFRLIEGPSAFPELEERFETRHARNAKHVCEDFGLKYFTASDMNEVERGMKQLISSPSCSVLEIFTDPERNSEGWKRLKDAIKLALR